MRSSSFRLEAVRGRIRSTVRRVRGDVSGATAIEFAIVAVPFLLLVLGIMTIGLQFLISHSLERGVETAARKLRTGEAQKAGLTVGDFRKLFCDNAGTLIACDDHLVLHIKSSNTFAGLSPLTQCVTDGNLTPSAANDGDGIGAHAGGRSQPVVVSVCYQWDLGLTLWQTIWNLFSPVPTVQDRPVLSAVTAFQSEPYE